jgi:hypothetical protein
MCPGDDIAIFTASAGHVTQHDQNPVALIHKASAIERVEKVRGTKRK